MSTAKREYAGGKGRHEHKIAMNTADCYLLRQKLKHVMKLDLHAGPNGTYFIRSVYFDNFDNKVLTEKKEGFFRRDKYRVRLYDFVSGKLYLEKKSKRDNLTFKQKCSITAEEYERIRLGQLAWMQDDERALVRELFLQMNLLQLKPITVVDYVREVYVYEPGNVRVTFDSSVKTSFRSEDLLNPDLAMIPALDPNQVIVEVKYDQYLPDVIRFFLQINDRRKEAFSKYQLSRMYG